jgi:hypothetical protein
MSVSGFCLRMEITLVKFLYGPHENHAVLLVKARKLKSYVQEWLTHLAENLCEPHTSVLDIGYLALW